MPHLSSRDREMLAIGAAMGSYCASCMDFFIPAARQAGLTGSENSEAIRLADIVRQVPARKVLDVARRMPSEATTVAQPAAGGGDALSRAPQPLGLGASHG